MLEKLKLNVMIVKYYLQIGANTVDINSPDCIEVTNMMADSQGFVTSYTRPYYNGVIRKSNSKLLLVHKARRLLIEEYKKNYLNAKAAFSVYCINNRWGFDKVWECPLDFATFEYDAYYAELFCKDNSATALIKSNNNTKFEFPVDELKDENQLKYDGIVMKNHITLQLTGESIENETNMYKDVNGAGCVYWIPPFRIVDDTAVLIKGALSYKDQEEAVSGEYDANDAAGTWYVPDNKNTTSYFLECHEDTTVEIDFSNLKIWDKFQEETEPNSEGINGAQLIFLFYKISGNNVTEVNNQVYTDTKRTISLIAGEKLQLAVCRLNRWTGVIGSTTIYMTNGLANVYWGGQIKTVDIDCISLNTLLGKILSSISSDSVTLTGSICETINGVENERLKNTKIVAAESIRQMAGAKIYTSFKDFSAFMESVFGYVYEIIPVANEGYTEDSVVTFKHRSEVFAEEVVKNIRIATEVRFCINKGLIYSALKIGYEKQDYENGNNGFDEFNFTNHYKTGTTLSTTTLELMCPYRADCYGFEQTAEKIGKSTESCDSDNDVFIVKVLPKLTNDKYIIDRTLVIEGAFSNTVFNGTFAPPYMVEANKRYIASFCKELEFASSEGNSTIIIGDIPMNGNIETNNPLFSVGEVAFKTNDFKLPENFQGLIEFEWEGRKYQGYLADVEISYLSSGILEYKLLERQV